jgi:hypothetical protein
MVGQSRLCLVACGTRTAILDVCGKFGNRDRQRGL